MTECKHGVPDWLEDCEECQKEGERALLEQRVRAKTKDIERVIGRFYIEAKKLENAGVQNKFGETDWFYDRMKVLADKIIEEEKP